MNNEPVVRQYATALFDIAEQSDILDVITTDLKNIQKLVSEIPELLLKLSSPSIDRNIRTSIFEKAFTGQVHNITLNLLKVVARNNRQALLHEIINSYFLLVNKRNNIVNVLIESACTLHADHKQIIKNNLDIKYKRNFSLTFNENRQLLGGFTILFENTFIDNSISGRLKKLRQDLNQL